MVKELLKKFLYYFWVINGYIGWKYRLNTTEKASILITYYHPTRIRHINHQIRNLLKCDFVERIIISNHNPDIRIEDYVRVRNEHIILINQNMRRGCGHRWLVASDFSPEYLVVLDDDILVFPCQLRTLFKSLVTEPEIPHGFAGMIQKSNGSLEYHQKEDQRVDYICEIYAITGQQLRQYIELRNRIVTDPAVAKSVEQTADFIIVSRSGYRSPKIHFAGHLLRCPSFNQAGIAVHKEKDFLEDVQAVSSALDSLPG